MNKTKNLSRLVSCIVLGTTICGYALESENGSFQKWGADNTPKNGIGPFIVLDALFWKAHQNNLEFVVKNSADTDVQLYVGPESSPDFRYDWGFRLGVGNTFKSHDNWDLFANWTHFNTSANKTVSAGSSYALQPILTSAYGGSYFADQASTNWRLNLNMIDLELGQNIPVSRFFNLQGFAGLRTAWVHQLNQLSYSGGQLAVNEKSPTLVDFKNHFWGIGILTGVKSLWGIAQGFSIYANADISLLAGFFDLSSKETTPTSTNNSVTDSFRSGKSIVDLALGIRWDRSLCNDHYHIGLQAGWEQFLFANQFQWQSQDSPPFTNTDLSITGWTFSGEFSF